MHFCKTADRIGPGVFSRQAYCRAAARAFSTRWEVAGWVETQVMAPLLCGWSFDSLSIIIDVRV